MSTNDPDFYQAPKFSPEQYAPPPRERGCFFYGCIIASILAVLMVILVSAVFYLGYRFLQQSIEQYTSPTRRDLPKVEMPAEQRQLLKDRVEAFRKAVDTEKPIEPLVLTSDDLNALIDENPDLKGKIYIKVEGDEVKGQVSIPCDALGEIPLMSILKGRYLNGEADLKASLEGGVLIVTLDSLEVNGQRLSDQIMNELRKQNLAKDFYKEEKASRMIRKIESLQIKDGKITLKVRAKEGASPESPSAKKSIPVEVIAPPPAEARKSEPAPVQPPSPKTPSPPAEAPSPKA
jgi:hypothetical protein